MENKLWGRQRRKLAICMQKTHWTLPLYTSPNLSLHNVPQKPKVFRLAPHTIWIPSSSAVFCRRSMTFSSSSIASPLAAAARSSDSVLAMM